MGFRSSDRTAGRPGGVHLWAPSCPDRGVDRSLARCVSSSTRHSASCLAAPRGGVRTSHPVGIAPEVDRSMGGRVPTQGIFPTFFISGFECSTFEWGDVGRRDLGEETRHRQHAAEDYDMLASLGIAVAREGVAWPFVDRGGAFDFSRVEPLLEAAADRKIVPIWDLCHYGYPDDITPAS